MYSWVHDLGLSIINKRFYVAKKSPPCITATYQPDHTFIVNKEKHLMFCRRPYSDYEMAGVHSSLCIAAGDPCVTL